LFGWAGTIAGLLWYGPGPVDGYVGWVATGAWLAG